MMQWKFGSVTERIAGTTAPNSGCVRQACRYPKHVALPLLENYDQNKTGVGYRRTEVF